MSDREVGRLPDWVVVGAMKSGTTSVAFWLDAHPEAWLVPNKEVNFFDRDATYAQGVDWYRERFADAPPGVAVGEATPSYLFVPEAPARMAALLPGARLIACLRDPVDRAYSHYWHNRHRGHETRSFADAVAAEMADPRWTTPGYLMRGRYLPQLERLVEHYDRSAVLVVLTDDLEGDPTGTFAAVCRHVGIDDTVPPPAGGEPANRYREHRAERLYRAMFTHRLWRWLPRPLRPRVAAALTRPGAYPPLPEQQRLALREWFADHDAGLAAWLGRELPWTSS
jgi:hypothetical protein